MNAPATLTPPLMTRTDVAVLLGMIASGGHRIDVGEAAVAWWREALAGYTLGQCMAAAVMHAKSSAAPPTPHDLIGLIRSARRTVLDRQVIAESAARTDPAGAASAAREHMAKIRAAMGWKRPDAHTAALTVACPVTGCLAAAGTPCRRTGATRKGRPESRELQTGVHPSRAELAAEQHHQADKATEMLPRKEIPA